MIGVIIFGLILFCTTGGLVYFVLYYPTKWFVKKDKLKIVRLIGSTLIGLFISIFYLFYSPANNNETATIEQFKNQYIVTVTGKRILMVHDPISLLKQGTYIESFKISIPRAEGIINGQEIPTESGYYKMLGTLTIDGEKININLFYNNYDDKIKEPLSWNGNYKLQWKVNK